jgi:hypothetical protein
MRQAVYALVLLTGVLASPLADAKGLVKVQQANGSIQEYPNATFHVVKRTLRITTADKKGTLIITDAACSYVEKLLRCLPYAVVLKQNGTFPIAIRTGTIYYNPTRQQQLLKYSSMQVPPNGVLGVMRSQHGTYVTISGEIDGGAQRR